MGKLINPSELSEEERQELEGLIEECGGTLCDGDLTEEEILAPEPEIYPVGTELYFVDVEIDGKIEKNVAVPDYEFERLLAEGKIR